MMRRFWVRIAWCVLFVGLGTLAGATPPEILDLQSAFSQAATLEKAVQPGPSRISPNIGQLQQDYEKALDRIEFLKKRTLQKLDTGLKHNDLSFLDAYLAFLQKTGTDEQTQTQFLPLTKAIRSKVIFASLTAREPHQAELQTRLHALEGRDRTPLADRADTERARPAAPIHIAFPWHMHQPIYWPYENIVTTHNRGVYSFSLLDVFFSRTGPYTDWPFNAVKACDEAGLPHGGAQVSFSGSLIENLNNIAGAQHGFRNWQHAYAAGRKLRTARGNPRLDLVSFGYHHPLMALIGYDDIRRQIQAHRAILLETFGKDVPYSKGIFPPENAFADWMIPALVDENLEWVMVDNIHFNRACQGYPWVKGENLYPPNPADQRNPPPDAWIQLNGLSAPSRVSAWADRPHWVEFIDPKTGRTALTPEGKKARIIAVPTERYLGNEDGRGGFGALNYEAVMSQLLAHNTDPKHPILLVLHHDGDNYGGGSYGYYHDNFRRFVEWVRANPDRFVCTTVQDYLDMFPPDANDVIHVEPGSWSGADNGDPEFLKWNGDPAAGTGYSPDRNSWGVMTACQNILNTARDQGVSAQAVREAERFLMVAQTSCYEYWDGTEMWDSHPTRACNQAVSRLLPLLDKTRRPDRTPPALYQPQRQPYNPGGFEWATTPETSDFTVWTYAYDVGGIATVTLRYRAHPGKRFPDARCRREAGGTWREIVMTGTTVPAQANPLPTVKADEYAAVTKCVKGALVDYYVEASDQTGNRAASPLLHVYVGTGSGGTGGGNALTFTPTKPTIQSTIRFTSTRPGFLHWGVNRWTLPPTALWPANTELWPDNKAVETPMAKGEDGKYHLEIGPFVLPDRPITELNAVLHFQDDTWGTDVTIPLTR